MGAVTVGIACLLLPGRGVTAPPLSKAAYEQKMQAIGQAYLREHATVIKHASSSNMARWARQAQQTATVEQHLVMRLDALVPPRAAAKDHRAMIAGFRVIAKWAAACHTAAAHGNVWAANSDLNRMSFAPAVVRGEAAASDLRAKGFNLGIFTRG